MAINYSLGVRIASPTKPELGNKTYPTAQYKTLLSANDLAEHMAEHNSKYNKGDILAVITQLASCIREQLLLGNKVEIGDLGAFSVTLISKGADNAEAFSVENISDVKVRWSPSGKLKNLINDASFQFVATRAAQAETRAAEKQKMNNLATVKPEDTTPGSGSDDEGNIGA